VNLEEYISSGVLESYAMDELSQTERQEVEKNLSDYPEICEELEKIELTLEKMAFATALKPKSSVKDKILGAVEAEKPAIQMESTKTSWMKYAAAASILVAFVSSFMAYNYYNKWKGTEQELSNLITQNQQIANDYNVVNQKLDKISADLGVINNAAFSRVALNGTDNSPESQAYIYWNASSQEVYLSVQNLKELSKEQQYQLWAIVDGVPVDAGVFNLADGLVKMKNVTGAAAFAVTVEPEGGSVNPSLETMQVVGNV
jgi:anti-sigma-K factor RskA